MFSSYLLGYHDMLYLFRTEKESECFECRDFNSNDLKVTCRLYIRGLEPSRSLDSVQQAAGRERVS